MEKTYLANRTQPTAAVVKRPKSRPPKCRIHPVGSPLRHARRPALPDLREFLLARRTATPAVAPQQLPKPVETVVRPWEHSPKRDVHGEPLPVTPSPTAKPRSRAEELEWALLRSPSPDRGEYVNLDTSPLPCTPEKPRTPRTPLHLVQADLMRILRDLSPSPPHTRHSTVLQDITPLRPPPPTLAITEPPARQVLQRRMRVLVPRPGGGTMWKTVVNPTAPCTQKRGKRHK